MGLFWTDKYEDNMWTIIFHCRKLENNELGSGEKFLDELLTEASKDEESKNKLKSLLYLSSTELSKVNIKFI